MLTSKYAIGTVQLQPVPTNRLGSKRIKFHWRRDVAFYYYDVWRWLCLPAILPEKKPICFWKEEHLPALPSRSELEDLWQGYRNHNIALLTGKRSGLMVGDVDPRHHGTVETLWALGWPQDTVRARSASGGEHVYVTCPVAGQRSIPAYAQGIELKADGALVIAPPSYNPKVSAWYTWLPGHSPWDLPVATLPESVLADIESVLADIAARRPVAEPHEPIELTEEQLTQLAQRAPKLVQQAVRRALKGTDGGRNNSGFWLACQLRDHRVSLAAARVVMLTYQREVEFIYG